MAFLLSPKTGESTRSYLLFSANVPVSINGGEAKTYGENDPGDISAGDVLTWAGGDTATIAYENNAAGSTQKMVQAPSPYTVEAVSGADIVYLSIESG